MNERNDLERWASEEMPGADVRGLLELHERLERMASEPVPDPAESWPMFEALVDRPAQLPTRVPKHRRALVTALAAAVMTASAAAAAPGPVRTALDHIVSVFRHGGSATASTEPTGSGAEHPQPSGRTGSEDTSGGSGGSDSTGAGDHGAGDGSGNENPGDQGGSQGDQGSGSGGDQGSGPGDQGSGSGGGDQGGSQGDQGSSGGGDQGGHGSGGDQGGQ